jgi:hypothetical protein
MNVIQHLWQPGSGWKFAQPEPLQESSAPERTLVLWFAAPDAVAAGQPYADLRQRYPQAHIVGCTTGGEIIADDVLDGSAVATVVTFERSTIQVVRQEIGAVASSREAGTAIAQALPADGLRAVFLLSDGILVNGSELVIGLRQVLGEQVVITGGLAGDGASFRVTHVGCDEAPRSGVVAAIGLYGSALRVGWGSYGGWDSFGPERKITRATANVLYEMDGEPALDLYRRYLGEEADRLPGSGLLFPLTVRPADQPEAHRLVRTIVGIDEAAHSLIFAGDVPEGYVAQLMRGNFDALVDGAATAADAARRGSATPGSSIAILISCIGRKILMGQRIVEEIEAVTDALGSRSTLTGFYSYGEIAPHDVTGRCELHNQTMTITTIHEE